MIEALSSKVEGDCLMIVAAGKIVSNEEYRLLLKRYCDEIVQSGLKKIIIDETNVDYAQSFLLQIDIVEFYSSEELPEEFSTWKFACVVREDMSEFSDFWVDVAQKSGYDHHGFSSIELAREYMSK